MIEVNCPRGLVSGAKIAISKCSNINCEFYSDKMSHKCFIIHNDIFFNNLDISDSVIKIGLNINETNLDLLYKAATFVTRLKVIEAQYKTLESCSVCGCLRTRSVCQCIDKTIRNKRRIFNEKWSSVINTISTEITSKEDVICRMLNLKGIRSIVRNNIHDVPFSFIFTFSIKYFKIQPWLLCENLGIPYKAYSMAYSLFISDNDTEDEDEDQ